MRDTDEHIGIMKYEKIQFFFRRHWTHFAKTLALGVVLSLITILAFLLIGIVLSEFQIIFLYSIFAFLAIISTVFILNTFFLHLFNYYFNVVIVTDNRIIVCRKTVYLINDNEAIDLTKIQDIGVVAHGFYRNYLNYGALVITLSTAAPPIFISRAPNPHYILEQLNRVKRAHILQRQVSSKKPHKANPDLGIGYLKDVSKLE